MLQKLSLPRKLHMTAESNSLKSYCFLNSVRRRYKLAFAAS
jgi:hypothetical protein